MSQIVLQLRLVESSIRRPTFPARESGPSVVEAETISSQDCPAPSPRSWALASPSLPLCRSCPERFGSSCGPRNQRCLHGQVASKLDPASSTNRTQAPLGHQRLGGPSVAAKAAIRSTPWAKLELNENLNCGYKQSRIVWRRPRWQPSIECWFHFKVLFPRTH